MFRTRKLAFLLFLVALPGWANADVDITVCVPESTYTSGGCTITYMSCAGDAGGYEDMVVPKECQAGDINRIADALKNAQARERYVEGIRHYFLDAPESEREGGGFSRHDLNQGFAYTALNLGPGSGPSGSFESTFGTAWDGSRQGTPRRAGTAPIGTLEEWTGIAGTLEDGASLVYSVANGSMASSLQQTGNTFMVGWKAILYGGGGDAVADAYIQNLRASEVRVLQQFHDHIVEIAAQVAKHSEQVLVASEVTRVRVGQNIQLARKTLKQAVKHLESGQDRLAPAHSHITKLTRLKVAELNFSTAQLASLRQGLLPPSQIEGFGERLRDLNSATQFEQALKEVRALQQAAKTDPNPLRQAQMQEVLQRHVNDQGLVHAWVAQRPGHLTQFVSDAQTLQGRRIRESANRALGTLTHSAKPEVHRAADQALLFARQADLALSQGKTQWAHRQWERSRQVLDYATNHPRVARYKTAKLSTEAASTFAIATTSQSYEGHQVVRVANALAKHEQALADPYVRFQAVTSVQAAARAVSQKDRLGAILGVDRAWRLHDYLEGFVSGIGVFVVDTATGIRELVTHPVDSAEALWDAVVHYDRTYEAIRGKVEQVIDEYPTMTTFEKAQLHGQIVAEVGSLFIGVGAIKTGVTAPKLTATLNRVSTLTENTVDGLKGLRRLQQRQSPLLGARTRSLRTTLQLGREVRELPESVLGLLEHHIKRDKLSQADAVQVLKFREGMSYFIQKQDFDRYRDAGPILGRPDGQFVTTKAAADSLEQICGQNSLMWEKRLGFPQGRLAHGNALYRVDLPFKWDYHPHLPRGTEGGAIQGLFKYGGDTSGGVPEILIHSPRYVDIVDEGTVTKLHFGPVVEE